MMGSRDRESHIGKAHLKTSVGLMIKKSRILLCEQEPPGVREVARVHPAEVHSGRWSAGVGLNGMRPGLNIPIHELGNLLSKRIVNGDRDMRGLRQAVKKCKSA